MNIKNKNVLIFGLGKSGISALKYAQKHTSQLFIYDDDKQVLKKYKKSNVNILQDEDISCIDLVVLSPGVSKDNEMLKKLEKLNVKIISELEFGYNYLKTKNIIAVTGTNGKTTTCELVSELLRNKYKTYKCGNIGIPICDYIDKINKEDYCVIEVSSFMLEDTNTFKPKIAVITNLAGDHLDRYKSIEEYQKVKIKITENQNDEDFLVVNNNLKNKLVVTNAKILYFDISCQVVGAYCKGNRVYYKKDEKSEPENVMKLSNLHLQGSHNIENILASICCAKLCKIDNEQIEDIINNFNCIEHRFERITNINGVEYVNDSKATNIHATLNAIKGIKNNIHLLLGGSDKGEDFDELFSNLPSNVFVYIFGSTTNKMMHSCISVGFKNFKICRNMKDALYTAHKKAKQRELVLLSPACASFDSFTNFEERGKQFKEWVFALYEKMD